MLDSNKDMLDVVFSVNIGDYYLKQNFGDMSFIRVIVNLGY